MLYHRGKPLLIQNKIGYMSPRLATLEQTAQFIPNLENESVFMKIQDDNTYLFAAIMSPNMMNLLLLIIILNVTGNYVY